MTTTRIRSRRRLVGILATTLCFVVASSDGFASISSRREKIARQHASSALGAESSPSAARRTLFLSWIVGSTTSAVISSPVFAENGSGMPAGAGKKKSSRYTGLAAKIRKVGQVMDELQRDLMQENWQSVETYPAQLRSFVPLFTTFTDSAFPTEEPTDKGLRVALRYEVGRFFASLERFRQAAARRSLDEAYVAYSDMSLHFDRYLHVGGLYTYYDDVISLEPYFKGTPEEALVYADPRKDPAEVRDLVVLAKGPDKGKTGIVIGIYPDGSSTCVVKLDRIKGMREIKVVPRSWAAKRLGEQDPDEAFLIPRKEKA